MLSQSFSLPSPILGVHIRPQQQKKHTISIWNNLPFLFFPNNAFNLLPLTHPVSQSCQFSGENEESNNVVYFVRRERKEKINVENMERIESY